MDECHIPDVVQVFSKKLAKPSTDMTVGYSFVILTKLGEQSKQTYIGSCDYNLDQTAKICHTHTIQLTYKFKQAYK